VSGGIGFSEIGFDLYDAAYQARIGDIANEHLAQQFAGDAARSASEEGASEWANRSKWRRLSQGIIESGNKSRTTTPKTWAEAPRQLASRREAYLEMRRGNQPRYES
jgi:hypothetical protein